MSEFDTINILMVDDHSIVKTGVKLLIMELAVKFNFFSASNHDEAVLILREQERLDLVILDINIPNYNCERMIELVKLKHPESKILILSMNPEEVMAKRFYKMGIHGYSSKNASDDELKKAINDILNNKKYFSTSFLQLIANELGGETEKKENPFEELSQREFDVLQLLIQGKSIQEISKSLSLHTSTISTYKSRIFEKLHTENVIDLYNMFNAFYKNVN